MNKEQTMKKQAYEVPSLVVVEMNCEDNWLQGSVQGDMGGDGPSIDYGGANTSTTREVYVKPQGVFDRDSW